MNGPFLGFLQGNPNGNTQGFDLNWCFLVQRLCLRSWKSIYPPSWNVFQKSIKVVVCNSMSCRLNTSLSYSCLICNRRDLHFAHNTFCTSNVNSYPYICSLFQVTSEWLSLQHQGASLYTMHQKGWCCCISRVHNSCMPPHMACIVSYSFHLKVILNTLQCAHQKLNDFHPYDKFH